MCLKVWEDHGLVVGIVEISLSAKSLSEQESEKQRTIAPGNTTDGSLIVGEFALRMTGVKREAIRAEEIGSLPTVISDSTVDAIGPFSHPTRVVHFDRKGLQ